MKKSLIYPFIFSYTFLFGQTFTRLTDPANPIVTDIPTMGYAGASWVDFDGDGDIDLFVNQDFLYRNENNGNFTRVSNSGIEGISIGYNNGNSWGDYDNDGDVDLMLVNRSKNGLFTNNGNGTFTRVQAGPLASNINAWSPAWGDYDNDGWLDLVATHACGGTGPTCHGNWLFHNNGDGSFTEITQSDVTTGFDSYTVANWSDFDDDGDLDLFIGSGKVSIVSRDHIYVNQLKETGTAALIRKQTGGLFGDLRDGQNWNLIDYDNDGDLDAFVTNYKQDVPNDFYRNDGNGSFTKLTDADLGVHMTSETGVWLTNTWGDFNNDGWIDAIITADFASGVTNHLYLNNGDGTFRHDFPPFTNFDQTRSASIGDYDNDGDLDLFINSPDFNTKGLYRNNLMAFATDVNWVNITLEGTWSNRTAIGAKVRVKANIAGNEMWQRRDISSQNSFAGHNSQRAHFGLGDAEIIDSILIEWPSGHMDIYSDVPVNRFFHFTEGQTTSVFTPLPDRNWLQATPNPFRTQLTLEWDVTAFGKGIVTLSDGQGRIVYTRSAAGNEKFDFSHLPSGFYYARLQTEKASTAIKLIRQ